MRHQVPQVTPVQPRNGAQQPMQGRTTSDHRDDDKGAGLGPDWGAATLAETSGAITTHAGLLSLDPSASCALRSLLRAAHIVRRELTSRALHKYDITWTGFVVLWLAWICDGMETRHVAESAGISKPTLTGVVTTLERRGLILRDGDGHDRRLVRLRLTADGARLIEQIYPEFNTAESELVAGLPGDDIATATRILDELATHAEGASGSTPRRSCST